MLRTKLCGCSDEHILAKGTIIVSDMSEAGGSANNTNKEVIFKNCALISNSISELNNTQIDDAKDIDEVMLIFNLI